MKFTDVTCTLIVLWCSWVEFGFQVLGLTEDGAYRARTLAARGVDPGGGNPPEGGDSRVLPRKFLKMYLPTGEFSYILAL